MNTERLDAKRIRGVADMWRADGHVRHADQLDALAAEVERLREERDRAYGLLRAAQLINEALGHVRGNSE